MRRIRRRKRNRRSPRIRSAIRAKDTCHFRRRADFRVRRFLSPFAAMAMASSETEGRHDGMGSTAFAGMPGSFPGRNEGEPFHVRVAVLISITFSSRPATATSRRHSLVYATARRVHAGCDVSMRTIGGSFPRLKGEQWRIDTLSDPRQTSLCFKLSNLNFVVYCTGCFKSGQ